MRRYLFIAVVATELVGCSTTPPVVLRYYPAQAGTTVTVTQTIDCNDAKDRLVDLESVSINTIYSSDRSEDSVQKLSIEELGRWYADNEINVSWYDDGRLRGINQSNTGQGEAIVKSAIGLAMALVPTGGANIPDANVKSACDAIASFGRGKPVTLTYLSSVQYKDKADTINLEPTESTKAFYFSISQQLPLLQLTIDAQRDVEPVAQATIERDVVHLNLFKIKSVRLAVTRNGAVISTGVVTVPTKETFPLPIPRAALIGRSGFSLALSEAGNITSIGYSKTSGASGLLNTFTAIDTTDANRASVIRGEADLIAQQQRLTRCKAQPDKCE